MIVTAFLSILYGVLSIFLNLIPVGGTFPQGFLTGLTFFITQAETWDKFVPVVTLFEVLGAVFLIEAGVFGFRAIDWLYSKIWGSSPSSGGA